jgi:hypothetical protein
MILPLDVVGDAGFATCSWHVHDGMSNWHGDSARDDAQRHRPENRGVRAHEED